MLYYVCLIRMGTSRDTEWKHYSILMTRWTRLHMHSQSNTLPRCWLIPAETKDYWQNISYFLKSICAVHTVEIFKIELVVTKSCLVRYIHIYLYETSTNCYTIAARLHWRKSTIIPIRLRRDLSIMKPTIRRVSPAYKSTLRLAQCRLCWLFNWLNSPATTSSIQYPHSFMGMHQDYSANWNTY